MYVYIDAVYDGGLWIVGTFAHPWPVVSVEQFHPTSHTERYESPFVAIPK